MAVGFNTTPVSGIDFSVAYTIDVDTNPEYPGSPIALGTMVMGTNGSLHVLCQLEAASTCTANDAVIITTNSTWEIKALTNALGVSKLGQMVGVADATGTAGQYVWVQVMGYRSAVNVATSSTAFTALHSSSTAGRLTSTAAGGTSVAVGGIVALATAASNSAAVMITNPVIGADD